MLLKDKSIPAALWAGMFILCATLGFLPEPEGANRWLLFAFSVLFFLPPAWLLWSAKVTKDRRWLQRIRNISIISLVSTVVLLVLNILSLLFPEIVGDILHYILILVSTPMICSQFWFVTLFLWAILLWCSLIFLKETQK